MEQAAFKWIWNVWSDEMNMTELHNYFMFWCHDHFISQLTTVSWEFTLLLCLFLPLYSAFSWFPKNNSVSGQYTVLLPLHQGYLEGLIQYKYLHFRFLQKPFIVLWACGVYQSYYFSPPVFCVINDYGYSAPFCESSRF